MFGDKNSESDDIEHVDDASLHGLDDLASIIYEELRALAHRWLPSNNGEISLQPTALVHEAYLKLANNRRGEHWNDKRHFFYSAAAAMRQILIDHARKKRQIKNGFGLERSFLDSVAIEVGTDQTDLLALDEALDEFEQAYPERAHVMKLRFFAGLSYEQIADCSSISESTAKRYWRFARAWLHRRLSVASD